jgi:hypothetical protein
MAKLISHDDAQRERYERVRAFEEAVRRVGLEHRFYVKRVQIDDDQEDYTIEVDISFAMDNAAPKNQGATGETIRLEEGRHEAL